MRKSELVIAVAEAAGNSERQADDVVAAMVEHVTNAMSRGESVTLPGFGAFSVKARQARSGRNPRSGAVIRIPACAVPQFKAGKRLREALS